MKNDLDSFDIINYHFRIATIGKKTIENVHFWKKGNWAFCHNGIIDAIGNENESDSQVFFNQLVKNNYLTKNNQLKGEKIKEFTNEQNFTGRFLIINLITKNIYFFGDFQCYLVNKSYLVFTSTATSFENRLNIMGLSFELENTIETIDNTLDGIWIFNNQKQQFNQIFETFKEWQTYYNPYNHNAKGSRKRDTNFIEHTFNFEEKEPLSRKEILITAKASEHIKKNKDKEPRSAESYLKEFTSRMKKMIVKFPDLEDDIESEIMMGQVNEWGRTDTEQDFWKEWIAPKLSKGFDVSFLPRQYDKGY
jgi:hypothetical protein